MGDVLVHCDKCGRSGNRHELAGRIWPDRCVIPTDTKGAKFVETDKGTLCIRCHLKTFKDTPEVADA